MAGIILGRRNISAPSKQYVDLTNYYDTSSGMKIALISLFQGNYSSVFLVYSYGETLNRITVIENASNVLRLEIIDNKLMLYNNAGNAYTVPMSIFYL